MNVPRLRFKEFQDQWKHKKVSEIMRRISRPVDIEPNTMYQQIGIRSHGKGLFHKEPVNGASLGSKRIFWLDENLFVVNIVFAWEHAVAKTTAFEKGMVASHRFPMYKPKENLADTDFILFFFLTNKGKHYLGLASPGGAGRNKTLGQKNFEDLVLIVPEVKEQTKIANFLTAIDEKITQLTQKHDLLKQYKKGVMQQIFSQKLRFKDDDGREFPEWNNTILGKVADSNIKWSFTGGPFGSNLKAEDYTENGVRIIQLQNIGDGIFNDSYKIYTSENKANELLSCNIYPNEIIISKMGDPVARCCIMPSNQKRYLMASDGIRLVVDKSLFNTKYIHDFINSEYFRKNALEASTGSTRRRIGLDELKKLSVIHPCLAEQTKIANFLTAIDNKITQTQTQLEAVKQYKKGLLQQMFV